MTKRKTKTDQQYFSWGALMCFVSGFATVWVMMIGYRMGADMGVIAVGSLIGIMAFSIVLHGVGLE